MYVLFTINANFTFNQNTYGSKVIGARLSEPHINGTAVGELCMHGSTFVRRFLPYDCTEAARNVLHCNVCVLNAFLYNMQNRSFKNPYLKNSS